MVRINKELNEFDRLKNVLLNEEFKAFQNLACGKIMKSLEAIGIGKITDRSTKPQDMLITDAFCRNFNVTLQSGYETNIPSLAAQIVTPPSSLASLARHTPLIVHH